MEEAAPHKEPDSSSGKGGTSGQSPAASGSVTVATPPAAASDAGGIQLPAWANALGWCGIAGLIYLLMLPFSVRSFRRLRAAAEGTDDAAETLPTEPPKSIETN